MEKSGIVFKIIALFLLSLILPCYGMDIATSSELTQEFLGPASDMGKDPGANHAWHFDTQSSGGASFNANIYFLEGSVPSIQSSSALSLSFETGYCYLSPTTSEGAAWYFDAGSDSLSRPFNANVYLLNGSIDSLTASPPLSLSFNGTYLSLARVGTSHAWYYDGALNPSDLTANLYYLNGAIDGITDSSFTNVAFLGPSPSLTTDSNPSAAWYYDTSLFDAGANYNGKVYYLIGSDVSIAHSNALTCTFQSSQAFVFNDIAQNTAWYGDTGNILDAGSGTVYYLQGDMPNIGESHRSFSFALPYVSIITDKTPNAAWYYNYYSDAVGFSGRIYYLEGSSVEIASSPSASFTFQTQNAGALSTGTENKVWYYDRGFISTPGFDGNIYYLNGSLDAITSTSATCSFQSQYADLILGKDADTAWYFDNAQDSTTPPFAANVYYLSGSSEALSSSPALTLSLNTNSWYAVLDPTSGGLWYCDYGGLGTGFDGKVYYLSGSTSSISSLSTTVSFDSNYAQLLSAGPNAVWYFNRVNPENSVYYIKVNAAADALSVYGWSSGVQGALLNTVFNTMLSPIQTMNAQASRRKTSSEPPGENLLVDAGKFPPCSGNKKSSAPYLFQLIPFYDFIHQEKQGSIPAFKNQIAGALATFDAEIESFVVGGGFAYTYNHAHLTGGLGHANVNQEVGTVYSSWRGERFLVGAALWGGFYQLKGVRETSGNPTSNYSTQGYTLTPHLELKAFTLPENRWLAITPFIMGDWICLWQKQYTEKGIDQTSIAVPSEQASLLRTEGGLYIQQFLTVNAGKIELLEKASYVNQLPFQQNSSLPLLVGSSPLFSIGTGTLSTQNLGAVEFKSVFYPKNRKVPFFGIDLQGEFGSKLTSYFIGIETGLNF